MIIRLSIRSRIVSAGAALAATAFIVVAAVGPAVMPVQAQAQQNVA